MEKNEKKFKLEGVNRFLSNTPSKAVKQCLEDLRMVEKNKNYCVNMNAWHDPFPGQKLCYVCLGGARLARLVDNHLISSEPSCAGIEKQKIISMDYFKSGLIFSGLECFYGLEKYDVEEVLGKISPKYADFPDYKDDRDGWYDGMEAVIKILEEHGF